LLDYQYVEHRIEIVNHECRDYRNVDVPEQAILHFSLLSTKTEERPTKNQEDNFSFCLYKTGYELTSL